MANLDRKIFDDSGRHLDRFGLLLVMATATVTLQSLVDLDNPTASLRSEVGWILVTVITGLTLILALRSSGMIKRIRGIAEAIVWVVVITAVLVTIANILGAELAGIVTGARPTIVWVAITFVSPMVVLRRIFVQKVITRATILGAISVYLLLAIAFNYAFLSVGSFVGEPFFNEGLQPTTSYMYFSLVTITTLGYGDLAPASEVGRFLSASEALIGQIFLVTVVARLVSMTTRRKKAPRNDDVGSR